MDRAFLYTNTYACQAILLSGKSLRNRILKASGQLTSGKPAGRNGPVYLSLAKRLFTSIQRLVPTLTYSLYRFDRYDSFTLWIKVLCHQPLNMPHFPREGALPRLWMSCVSLMTCVHAVWRHVMLSTVYDIKQSRQNERERGHRAHTGQSNHAPEPWAIVTFTPSRIIKRYFPLSDGLAYAFRAASKNLTARP